MVKYIRYNVCISGSCNSCSQSSAKISMVSCTLIILPYFVSFSFPNSASPSPSTFPFPNDVRRNPLNIKTPVRAIATFVYPRGTFSNNAVTKEIAAPTRLNGNHFLSATDDLSKFQN